MKYKTTILVPNFNGQQHLKDCLTSLAKQSYKEIKTVFIDNASKDKSVQYVKDLPGLDIDILCLDRNYGFAHAINNGVKYCIENYNPKYIALLNNDTKVDKNWLKYLIKAIESESNIAAVASNILFYDNPEIINSQGATSTIIGDGYGINMFKRREDIKRFPKKVIFACGAAMLLKTESLNEIGLFDDRYFAYNEDLDWGWRANLFGYKIIFAEKAIVYHKFGASWKKYALQKTYLCKRNGLCTVIKNYELKTLIKIIPLLFINYTYFSIGYLLNRKIENFRLVPLVKNLGFCTRFKYVFIPTRALIWNIANFKKTLTLRKQIQPKRKIADSEIFKLIKWKNV